MCKTLAESFWLKDLDHRVPACTHFIFRGSYCHAKQWSCITYQVAQDFFGSSDISHKFDKESGVI